jgi:phosphatidate cytidylyltransferase
VLCLIEFYRMQKKAGTILSKGLFYTINIFFYLLAYLASNGQIGIEYLLAGSIIISVPFIAILFQKPVNSYALAGGYLFSVFYVTIPLSLLNFIQLFEQYENTFSYLILALFLLLWLNDSFAYIVGSLFGRHKIFEEVSPRKTWEGSIGGLVFSLAGSYLLFMYFDELTLMQWFGFAMVVIIFGTFGDLFESVLKRNVGIKESGNVIPGHGGMLDRLDSLLLSVPFVFLYLLLILS